MKAGTGIAGTRPGDYLLAAAVLIVSLGGVIAPLCHGARPDRASIYRAGKLVQSLDLRADRIVRDVAGAGMDLEIREGRVRVARTECPRKVCRQAGWVSGQGRTIVCIPNQILIELSGAGETACDAIAY